MRPVRDQDLGLIVLRRYQYALFHTMPGRLLLLTAALVLPATLIAASFVFVVHRSERLDMEVRLADTSRALSLVVDRQLGQSEALLRGLATSEDLLRGDFAAFHRQAERALVNEDQRRWIVLIDADGRQLVNTFLPLGSPLPTLTGLSAYREIFLSDRTVVSDLVPARVRDGHVVSVSIPVRVGERRLRLVLVVLPSTLGEVLADQRVPEGWVATIVDAGATVVARNRLSEKFTGVPATPDVRAALATDSAGVLESVNLEGVPMLLSFARSRDSNWTVLLGAPRAQLAASAAQWMLFAFLGCCLLLAVGIAASTAISRRMLSSMDSLRSAAARLGDREPAQLATGMRETDQVAEALRQSALALRRREEELQRLNSSLEAQVAEATETLVQARKLEAVGRLTGGIAHDFNNLLTAVRVNLELLARRLAPEEARLRRHVDGARHATDRGVALVAQLMAFARKQNLRPEPVDVNAVVAQMSGLLRSTLGGSVQVEAEPGEALPPALADRTQLELIIMNLAINARDAMPSGGRLRIVTGAVELEERRRPPEFPPPGRYLAVTVADEGTGMADDVLSKVFEPFFTTKAAGRGNGLGLSQVLGIAKQLGGGVGIDSAPGRGTRVTVYLPPATEPVRAAPERPAGVPATDLQGLRVLLVDDDAEVREAIAALLLELGCQVTEADGGAAALACLELDDAIDVALLDHAMPQMLGSELGQELRRRHPALQVVLMSGYAETAALRAAWPGEVLRKPFSRGELAEWLSRRPAA